MPRTGGRGRGNGAELLTGKGFLLAGDTDTLKLHCGNGCTNLDNILKSRNITLLTKVCIVKAVVFPVIMYVHESWTIKKAEH